MLFTGSPTKLNKAKHRNDTASMTARDCSRRETMKASMTSGVFFSSPRHTRGGARAAGGGVMTPPAFGHLPTSLGGEETAHLIGQDLKFGELVGEVGTG